MTDRWRKGVRLLAVENLEGATTRIGDRVYPDVQVTIDEETNDRIRAGYVCIGCYEPHETPFPAVCPFPGCGLSADEARRRIARELGGVTWLGPRMTLEDEEAQLQEENARRIHRMKQSIWLPNTLKEE